MLHTVNKTPFASSSLESCLRFIAPGDVLLLIEDGVYAAMQGTVKSALVEQALNTRHAVYALEADVLARGLGELIPGVKTASYDDFVELLEQHRSHAWL